MQQFGQRVLPRESPPDSHRGCAYSEIPPATAVQPTTTQDKVKGGASFGVIVSGFLGSGNWAQALGDRFRVFGIEFPVYGIGFRVLGFWVLSLSIVSRHIRVTRKRGMSRSPLTLHLKIENL